MLALLGFQGVQQRGGELGHQTVPGEETGVVFHLRVCLHALECLDVHEGGGTPAQKGRFVQDGLELCRCYLSFDLGLFFMEADFS